MLQKNLSNSLSSSLIDDLWLCCSTFSRGTRSPKIFGFPRLWFPPPQDMEQFPQAPQSDQRQSCSFSTFQLHKTPALWQIFSLVWRRFKHCHTFPGSWYAIFRMSHEQNNFKGIPVYQKKNAAPQGPLWSPPEGKQFQNMSQLHSLHLHMGFHQIAPFWSCLAESHLSHSSLHHFYTTIVQNNKYMYI